MSSRSTPRQYLLPGLILGLVEVLANPTCVAAESVSYVRDIKPLLKNKCYACHGRVKQESGLRLDAGKLVLRGGDGGEVVWPGTSGDSPLIARVTATDHNLRMPPEGAPLSVDQIELLRAWIDQGAKFPSDETIAAESAEHWAFQPVRPPPIPSVDSDKWPLNPIDHFILVKLQQRGWRPNGPAEPHTLLRRAYLNLIGLPPTLAEQDEYLQAPTRQAYDRMIQHLLDRPGYGERFARYWLDVVRYADSNGYERDGAKPEVWRYRDYVIRALNEDKPFDQFVLEQLAGDELPAANTDTVVATGFNRLGPWDDEPADFDVDRYDQLDDMVNTTSQAFLGLTMGCARCHDHKFDPLTQRDYYGMVAVFNPLGRPQQGRTELTRFAAPPALTRKLEERDKQVDQFQDQIQKIRRDHQVAFLASGTSELPPIVLEALLTEESKRTDPQRGLVRDYQPKLDALVGALPAELSTQVAALESRVAKLRETIPDVPQGYFMYEPAPTPPVTRILVRGSPHNLGDEVGPSVPSVLVQEQPRFLAPDEFTSRRRLSLARWIVDQHHPLTPRVIVNRVWQWHFGEGLVRTPNDFGLLGQPPTHPELLDYLANWFVHEADWSLKKLHHFIMSSRTYQMSRDFHDEYAAEDPENRLLWRQSYRRVEVEVIRDSMLFVSGQLNRQMYGPPMHPFIPRDALLNHADKTSIWPDFDERQASRRTVYAFIKRSLLVPLLEVLDLCDTTRTFPKRNVTTVPTQALTLYNGDFVNRQARHLAERLRREVGNRVEAQIQHAWRLAFCRSPHETERDAMEQFIANEVRLLREEAGPDVSQAELSRRAMVQLCRVLFNMNEFVYPD